MTPVQGEEERAGTCLEIMVLRRRTTGTRAWRGAPIVCRARNAPPRLVRIGSKFPSGGRYWDATWSGERGAMIRHQCRWVTASDSRVRCARCAARSTPSSPATRIAQAEARSAAVTSSVSRRSWGVRPAGARRPSWLVGKSLVRGLSNTRDVKSRRVDLVL
jgi:hypothetical protein